MSESPIVKYIPLQEWFNDKPKLAVPGAVVPGTTLKQWITDADINDDDWYSIDTIRQTYTLLTFGVSAGNAKKYANGIVPA
jgi:hypothetical protein